MQKKMRYLVLMVLLIALVLSSIGGISLTIRMIVLNISGEELDSLNKIAYAVTLEPGLIGVLDFREIDNSTLNKLFIKTYYSRSITIPSNRVYVRDGCLYLSGTEHLVINTSYIGVNRTNYLLIRAYVEYINGGYEGFSRGGIGFYGTTEYDEINGYYVSAPYWLSVIGSFNTSEPVSYDFEGHITWLNNQWGFSESVNKKIYKYNTTYMLWIALVDNYVIGGIDALPRSWIFYINGTYYLPEVVSHAGTICIRRIEFYDISKGSPKTKTVVLPKTLLDFDTFSNLSLVYIRLDLCRQYIFDTGRFDETTSTLYVFVKRTETCIVLPYTNNIPMIYNSGKIYST